MKTTLTFLLLQAWSMLKYISYLFFGMSIYNFLTSQTRASFWMPACIAACLLGLAYGCKTLFRLLSDPDEAQQ